MNKRLPLPTVTRFGYLYDVLQRLIQSEQQFVSSAELGIMLGQKASTIRKDIHFLGCNSPTVFKYDVKALHAAIKQRLGFDKLRLSCIVGLGKLGSALLDHATSFPNDTHRIVAGFDSNVNRLETIRTSIELFPAYRIESVILQKQIELAIIAVPGNQAQDVVDKCCNGGIRGILNYSPASVTLKKKNVFLKSFDVSCELNILSALVNQQGIIDNN